MKRITSLIIFATFLICLVACGGKPKDMSDGMYQLGLNALAVADQYIAFEIDAIEAQDKLGEIRKLAEKQEKKEEEELGVDYLYGTKYEGDEGIAASILILELSIGNANSNFGDGTMSDVIENRNFLAELLGE